MKLFESYDLYMSLVVNHKDWVVFMDGDTLFFQSNLGHLIKDYIDQYPTVCLFATFHSLTSEFMKILQKKMGYY